jgi:hypothetical protein
MGKFRFVVFSSPADGAGDAYEAWWGAQVREAAGTSAFGPVRRYRLINLAKPAPHQNLAVFEMNAGSIDAAAKALEAAGVVGRLKRPEAAIGEDVVAAIYEVSAVLSDPGSSGAGAFGLLAMTSPIEGRERAFDAWYVYEHMREVLDVPGFADAERVKLRQVLVGQPQTQFLGIYGMEADSLAGAGGVMQEAGKAGMKLSDTLAPTSGSYLLEAC